MEILILMLVFAFGWAVGVLNGWCIHKRHIDRQMKNMFESMKESIDERVIKVKLEMNNGVVYMYKLDTNEFMGQGKSEEDLSELLRKKYPGKIFAASEENLKECGFNHEPI